MGTNKSKPTPALDRIEKIWGLLQELERDCYALTNADGRPIQIAVSRTRDALGRVEIELLTAGYTWPES